MIGREITTNGCLGNGFSEMNMARYGRMDTGGEPPKATSGSRATIAGTEDVTIGKPARGLCLRRDTIIGFPAGGTMLRVATIGWKDTGVKRGRTFQIRLQLYRAAQEPAHSQIHS